MTVLRTNTIAGIGETFGPLLDGDLEFNSQNYIVLPKGSSNQQGVLRTTEDVIGVGGTYYDNLVLAMPFNEATGFRDVSSRNRNPAAYGNVAISTAQSKYYGSSAYFDGSGDYLSIDVGISTSTSDFVLGPSGSNFTIELYLYATSSSNIPIISTYSDWSAPSGYLNRWGLVFQTNSIKWFGSDGNGIITEAAILNQWVHYAICRNGSTITMYRNGTSIGTQTTKQDYTLTNPLLIGYIPGLGYYNGYIQDLRIYKGLAKYTANFTPPERIAEIGVGFKTGALRYNTDSNKVELYDGSQWAEVQSSRPDLNGGARGVFGGGGDGVNVIQYVTISTTGNAQDFGDLPANRTSQGACSSSTRGIFSQGYSGIGNVNTIDYVTISSTGNAQTFGEMITTRRNCDSCSNETRAIFAAGYTSVSVNNIEYLTISSTGNSIDFGDTDVPLYSLLALSSPTRGVFGGGFGNSPIATVNTIQYITISTLGDTQDFGDLTSVIVAGNACSSSTRGLFGGGYTPTTVNTIEYIEISSLGNAINFGDLTVARSRISSTSSKIRGLWSGGFNPATINVIDYVSIATQGNAVDFGDLISGTEIFNAACSNAHGGL